MGPSGGFYSLLRLQADAVKGVGMQENRKALIFSASCFLQEG